MEVYADVIAPIADESEFTPAILEQVTRDIFLGRFGKPLDELTPVQLIAVIADAAWHCAWYQQGAKTDPAYYEPRWAAAVKVSMNIQVYAQRRVK